MEALFRKISGYEAGGPGIAALRAAASVVSGAYGGLVFARHAALSAGVYPAKRLPAPVVSVGNLVLGGTGKTPMTVALARLLRGEGLKPAVLSRGYRGKRREDEAVVSSGKRIYLTPEEAGEEPVLIANAAVGVPVLVGKNRWQTGRRAIRRFGADVVILDDGFQHFRVQRDLNILLLDARRPFGTERLFPRGDLREGKWAVKRADAIVLTRFDQAGEEGKASLGRIRKAWPEIPVFTSRHRPGPLVEPRSGRSHGLEALRGLNVLAFCGLARPGPFFSTLRSLGAQVVEEEGFPDHHGYQITQMIELEARARSLGADALVTTEKDLLRLPCLVGPRLFALGVEIDIGQDFRDFVLKRVKGFVQTKPF